MTEAEQAYAAAERLIAEAKASGAERLSFDREECRALTAIPPQIAMLDRLTFLDLDRTQVSDLAPLAVMTGMTRLHLTNTQVSDLAPLVAMTEMRTLTLDNTRVSDLAPLAAMTGMTGLSLNGTPVSDIAPLARLTNLNSLHLNDCPILDLAPLRKTGGLLKPSLFALLRLGLTFKNTAATRADPRIAEIAEIEGVVERAQTLFAYLENWVPPSEIDEATRVETLLRGPVLSEALVDIVKTDDEFEATAFEDAPDREPDQIYRDILDALAFIANRLGRTEAQNRIGLQIAEAFRDYGQLAAATPVNPRMLRFLAEAIAATVDNPSEAASLDSFDLSAIRGFLRENQQLLDGYFARSLAAVPMTLAEADAELLARELPSVQRAALAEIRKAQAEGVFAPSVAQAIDVLLRRSERASRQAQIGPDEASREAARVELRRNAVLTAGFLGRVRGRMIQWLNRNQRVVSRYPLRSIGGASTFGYAVAAAVDALTPYFQTVWAWIGNLPLPF